MANAPEAVSPPPDRNRGNLFSAHCPSRSVLDHVTSRWGSLVLVVLLERTYRFSELARRIGGVSEKMLAQSLQKLEADGFVRRTVYPTVPPKVDYSLTELGREVAVRVRELTAWVEQHVDLVMQIRAASNSPSVPAHNLPLAPLPGIRYDR